MNRKLKEILLSVMVIFIITCIFTLRKESISAAADETGYQDGFTYTSYCGMYEDGISLCAYDGSGSLMVPDMIDGKKVLNIREDFSAPEITALTVGCIDICFSKNSKLDCLEELNITGFSNVGSVSEDDSVPSGYVILSGCPNLKTLVLGTDDEEDNMSVDLRLEGVLGIETVVINSSVKGITCYTQNDTVRAISAVDCDISGFTFSYFSKLEEMEFSKLILEDQTINVADTVRTLIIRQCKLSGMTTIQTSQTDAALNSVSVLECDIAENSSIQFDCSSVREVDFTGSNLTEVFSYMFSGCTRLERFVFNSPIYKIGYRAFDGCSSLSELQFTEPVTMADDYAFQQCTALGKLNFIQGIAFLGDGALSGCTALKELELGDQPIVLGCYVFQNCSSLEQIVIPQGSTYENEGTGLADGRYERLEAVTYLEYGIDGEISDDFSAFPSLETVIFTGDVRRIAQYAFSNCLSLRTVQLPKRLEIIESYAFQYCSALEEISFPVSLTEIGWNAFEGCISLKTCEFPSGLLTISNNAFLSCTELKKVSFCSSVQRIGLGAFVGTGLRNVTLPGEVEVDIYNTFPHDNSSAGSATNKKSDTSVRWTPEFVFTVYTSGALYESMRNEYQEYDNELRKNVSKVRYGYYTQQNVVYIKAVKSVMPYMAPIVSIKETEENEKEYRFIIFAKNGAALTNALLKTWDDTFAADSFGKITVPEGEIGSALTFVCEGYDAVQADPSDYSDTVLNYVFMAPEAEQYKGLKSAYLIIREESTDVVSEYRQILLDTDIVFTLKCFSYDNEDEISVYRLWQQGRLLSQSTSGIMKNVAVSGLSEGGDLYVEIIYKDGSALRAGLLAEAVIQQIFRQEIKLSEGNTTIKVSKEIPFLGNEEYTIDLKDYPITMVYNQTTNKVRVSYNVKDEYILAEKDKESDYDLEKLYEEFKNAILNETGSKRENILKKIKAYTAENTKSRFLGFEVETVGFAYGEYTFDPAADKTIKVEATMILRFSVGKTWYFYYMIPFYVNVSVQGEFGTTAAVEYNITEGTLCGKWTTEGEMTLSPAIGVGINEKFGGDVRGTGTLYYKLRLLDTAFPPGFDLITLKARAELECYVGGMRYEKVFYENTWRLYPELTEENSENKDGDSEDSTVTPGGAEDGEDTGENTAEPTNSAATSSDGDADTLSLMSLDEDADTLSLMLLDEDADTLSLMLLDEDADTLSLMSLDGDADTLSLMSLDGDLTTLIQDAYGAANPKLVTCGETVFAFFIGIDSSRAEVNATALYYCVWQKDQNCFSKPVILADNQTADISFAVQEIDGSLYVVWQEVDRVLSSQPETLEEYIKMFDISVSVYQASAEKFSEPVILTKGNGIYDYMPTIACVDGNPAVFWCSNETADYFGVKTASSVFYRIYKNDTGWQPQLLLRSGICGLYSMLGVTTGEDVLFLCIDGDGDFLTTGDGRLEAEYYNTVGSTGCVILSKELEREAKWICPADIAQNVICWCEKSTWYYRKLPLYTEDFSSKKEELGNEVLFSEKTGVSGDFYFNGSDIYFTSLSGEGTTVLYCMSYCGPLGEYTDPVAVYEGIDRVRSVSVAEGLRMLYLAKDNEDESETVYHIDYCSVTENVQISLLNTFFDYTEVSWGNELSITLSLQNTGTAAADALRFLVYSADHEVLYSYDAEGLFPAGIIQEYTIYPKLPETVQDNLYVEIIPLRYIETSVGTKEVLSPISDAAVAALVDLSKTELAVSGHVMKIGAEYYLILRVENESAVPVTGLLLLTDAQGNRIESAVNLMEHNLQDYMFSFDKLQASTENVIISFEVLGDKEEYYQFNNADTITLPVSFLTHKEETEKQGFEFEPESVIPDVAKPTQEAEQEPKPTLSDETKQEKDPIQGTESDRENEAAQEDGATKETGNSSNEENQKYLIVLVIVIAGLLLSGSITVILLKKRRKKIAL